MALNTDIRAELAMGMLDAISPLIDAGSGAIVVVFEGTQPADCDAADAGTKLGELTMAATAFGSAADATPNSTITAGAIADETDADATGTAQYFRVYSTTGGQAYATKAVCYIQGSVGTSSADLILDSVSIAAGGTISISSYVITLPYLTA
jgi:hypothetical protein